MSYVKLTKLNTIDLLLVMNFLTPTLAKEARNGIGLSQAKVARELNIGRTKLALFEVEKYLLDDACLTTLKQFYEQKGYCFDAFNPTVESAITNVQLAEPPSSQVIDGYVVSTQLSDDEAQELIVDIHTNELRIDSLAIEHPKVGFWDGVPDKDSMNELLKLCAQSYLYIRTLQGITFETGSTDTVGAMLLELLNNHANNSTL